MNTLGRLLTVSCVILLLSACSKIPGSQYFGGQGSKPIKLEPLAPITPSLSTRQVWQVTTGSAMGENKVRPYLNAAANTLYVAGGKSASAWSTNTGKSRWKTSIGEPITAGVNGTLNKSTSEQQLFIGTSNGNAIALDANTGKIQWIERLSSEILAVSPSSDNRVVFRTVEGKLHALNTRTGELIWQQTQKTPALTQLGAGVPIIASGTVIAGFDNGKIAAYQLQTGERVWQTTLALPAGNSDLEQMVDADGALQTIGNNALFASTLNGNLAGIKLPQGQIAWKRPFSSATGVDVTSKGLYSSDQQGIVWAFAPQSGDPIWSMDDLKRRQPSTPMILNNATLVVTDKHGNVHFINSADGQFVAREKGDPKGYSVNPVVSGNSVYVLGKSGILSKFSL